ncbi:MAG: EF-Tu/IF-2/RF-3 family GTPase [Thermoplasmataceae archaeon]
MVNSINLFAFGVDEFLRKIFKKGTESDITIYNRKEGDNFISVLVPLRFPDKLSSLTDSMFPADIVVLNGDIINRELGEVIICAELMKKKKGYFICSPETDVSKLKKMVSNTIASNYEIYTDQPMNFLGEIVKFQRDPAEGKEASVVIDHFFKVKSVGTVILGFVTDGKISRHQDLIVSYSNTKVQIRTIQMNDIDFETAEIGSRVGIALKGGDTEELERGSTLTPNKPEYLKTFTAKVTVHPMAKGKLQDSSEIFLAGNMRYQRGRITGNEIEMDSGIQKFPYYLLLSPNTSPRIIGIVEPVE